MKIAYFTDTFAPEVNGVTNTLSKLGTWLDRKNIRHLVFAPDYDGQNPHCDSSHRRVHRFKGITTSISPKSRLAFPAFWGIDEICDNFMPDVIHVTTEMGIGFRGMRYAQSRNLPLVMSFHTDYCKYLKYHNLEFMRPVLENYLAWFYRFSARTLAPSRHTLRELLGKGYRSLDIWSRGIDVGAFNPGHRNDALRKTLGGGKFIFLYVGRLSAEKSLDMLLYAAAAIERRFPGRAVFVFTGDGPYIETIHNARLANIVCTGFKRGVDLSRIYASADCFAFPSGTETFGNVVLEAMASGLPVAAVAGGGVTDFLSHNENALLSEPEDTEAFTNNLVSIMENENLRSRLAGTGRQTALSRDWNRIFDGLFNVYLDAVEEYHQYSMKNSA